MVNPSRAAFVIAGLSNPRSFVERKQQQVAPLFSVPPNDADDEQAFLMEQLARIESMEKTLDESFDESDFLGVDDDDDDDDFDDDFSDLFDNVDLPDEDELVQAEQEILKVPQKSADVLEEALRQGVVPAGADVGSEALPGDWGFDPLDLATKDYIGRGQLAIQRLIPGPSDGESTTEFVERPSALILRDYREAEIRHGRLAMLASLFWPLQEMADRFVLDESQYGSLIYGKGVTLPYFPLLMTAILLLLGYLDIYSQATKDLDRIGEAFEPGDCFWDPLAILQGAPDRMKRNMQERELLNGRMAMLACAVFFWEELTTHQPIIDIESNALLFEPFYEIPFLQQWLDSIFQSNSPVFVYPEEQAAAGAVADGISDVVL